MKEETNIKLPIRITRGEHLDYRLMARAYAKVAFDYIDYVCVHNKLPSINR